MCTPFTTYRDNPLRRGEVGTPGGIPYIRIRLEIDRGSEMYPPRYEVLPDDSL